MSRTERQSWEPPEQLCAPPAPSLRGGGAVAQGRRGLPWGHSELLTDSQPSADVVHPENVYVQVSKSSTPRLIWNPGRLQSRLHPMAPGTTWFQSVGPGAIGWKQDSCREIHFKASTSSEPALCLAELGPFHSSPLIHSSHT